MPEKQPEKMRAIAIGEDKTPDSLFICDVPTPQPTADEILVRVGAAGVNRGDCVQRIGFYPPPPGASEIMGLDELNQRITLLQGEIARSQAMMESKKGSRGDAEALFK